MKGIMIVAIATFFVAFSFGIAYAHCGACGDLNGRAMGTVVAALQEEESAVKSAEEGEVINDFCPVTGDKIDKDTPYITVYKGKTIGFCCGSCPKAFKSNPEKYMSELEKQESLEPEEHWGSHQGHMH